MVLGQMGRQFSSNFERTIDATITKNKIIHSQR